MRKFLTLTAATALVAAFGFAAPAQAHISPLGLDGHGDFECKAKESGSFLGAVGGVDAGGVAIGADLVISHGKSSELGRTRSQGAFKWGTFLPVGDGVFCADLLEGSSVTRASNGDLVFITYDSNPANSRNCGDGITGTVDLLGTVTGGTGAFSSVSGKGVHAVSEIHITGFVFSFGGVTTDSRNQCLK